MWFKNLYLYQFEKEFDQDADSLHEALSLKPFTDCTPNQRESFGWVPPLGKNATAYTHAASGFTLMAMAHQTKILPAQVVREALQELVTEIQEREDRKVGSKEKKELTEQIEDELMPRAFAVTSKMDAYIDPVNGLLVINTTSSGKAEAFATLLRKTIGSLPVVPLKTEGASPAMTQWLSSYQPPQPFEIGEETELKSGGEDQGIAAFRKHELGTDEVKANIEGGKVVSKLGLVWDKKISFVATDELGIKKLKFLDVLEEKMNEEDPQSHEDRMDIEFTLMTGELSQFFAAFIPEVGGK